MRKPIIAANWKMYKTAKEAGEFCALLKLAPADLAKVESIIFAPFTALSTLKESLAQMNISVGAQNFYPAKEGAFTGEISLGMLKEIGVKYVLIGHSERRLIFKEDNQLIAEKLQAALAAGLIPILCCGEEWEVREKGEETAFCIEQIKSALQGLADDEIAQIIIAYEPVWAIGTGKSATPADAEKMISAIRQYVNDTYGTALSENMRIIYGGSVKVDNIAQLMQQENIDGALIGGAGLKAESFAQLVRLGRE